MKLTPEQDARISAKYGLTPNWSLHEPDAYHDALTIKIPSMWRDDGSTLAFDLVRTSNNANTRAMAAAKHMIALLERVMARGAEYADESGVCLYCDSHVHNPSDHSKDCVAVAVCALLDALKGVENETK